MIYLTGDLHGDLERFKSKEMKKLKKGDTLIVCGDFGFLWDGSKKEQSILKKLGRSKYQILFVEGTHDNLDLIAQYPLEDWNGGKVRHIGGSLYKLERGSVFTLEGRRFFDELTEQVRFQKWFIGCYHMDKVIPPRYYALFSKVVSVE